MVGGSDIILETFGREPATVLESVARVVLRGWPNAVLVNGATGERFESYATASFGGLRELLVFRDEASRDIWERLGAEPGNAHTMIYAIATSDQVTLVAQDPRTDMVREVVSELESIVTAVSSVRR